MSAKSGIEWRLSERSVYCYGSKQAEQMPYRLYLYHNKRRTVYGFLTAKMAVNFLFERVPAVEIIYFDEDYCNFYYMMDNAILVSKVGLSDILVIHYHRPLLDCTGV